MRSREISESDARHVSEHGEDHFFDRKALPLSGNQVQKVAVAFANADGGEFVIGVADDKAEPDPDRRWNGANEVEDFNPHLQVLFELQPPLQFTYEFLTCTSKNGLVLRVSVEKSSEIHKTSDGTVYQRLGAQSLPIKDPQRIMELTFAKGSISYEDQLLNGLQAEQVVETEELRRFLNGYSPKTDPLDFIVNQHLVDAASWTPRVAGVLLFNPTPSACLPKKCAVKVVRYETKEDEPERDHLKTQTALEGPLYQVIHDAVREVTEIMSSISIWTPEGLRTVNYPPEAVWEVIVNAVIHRDYSISDDVHVYIYNNRIEILSPGRLPGYVTVDNILDARYSRNPKIVRTLNRYPDPPNKDLGEGLNTAFQKMKEWKLRSPEISENSNYVKVVLPHTPLASPSEGILEFLAHNERITNRQARDITGIRSENLVKVEFYKLRDEGLIERVPGLEGPASAWQKVETAGARAVQDSLPLDG